MTSERQLRRRCRQLLTDLDIHPPLDVTELCRRVGVQRGKPIRLRAHPIPVPGPFGAWVAAASADYIFYQQETSKPHQDHIILHELGHMLAGHDSDAHDDTLLSDLCPGSSTEALRAEYPDLAPDAVRRALRRTSYDTEQEYEAETVATIILEWASVLDRVWVPAAGNDTAHRMETALSDRLGWL
ncbi:hypothetical protein ATK30_5623 [Amycolatopsis echigonensis]|uniref:IrrE N-terminal-like domain-containing protein n=1 Tax=Amycolatopsis echigonensis TaxID=2576905 RepID=A0A2N3WLH7_9PSEU|nr:hypothetical protein [Amycolatopsis niigatensis]PKV94741.1 hypothetical protein ATK30_5623 [Amycolatopsis niigatensis]